MVARSDLDGVRKQVFTALRPLDRGDFRWEFLVPAEWRDDKDLTTREKFIVCSTFIGIALGLQALFDSDASVGVHLSYIAQFFSYAIGNPIGFRIIAIVSSLLEVLGDLLESAAEKEDAIPVVYNVLFIPINSYYVIRWLLNREAGTFTEEEEALYSSYVFVFVHGVLEGIARPSFNMRDPLLFPNPFKWIGSPTTQLLRAAGLRARPVRARPRGGDLRAGD